QALLAKKKPADAPVETKAEELKATVAALKTAQATNDKVNPPEAQEALEASVEPAPVEGAKKRGRKPADAPKPTPGGDTPVGYRGPLLAPGEATGEIEFVDSRENGEFCIHVITKTWPTSRKIAITFLPE